MNRTVLGVVLSIVAAAALLISLPFWLPPKVMARLAVMPDPAHRVNVRTIGGARVVLSTDAVDHADPAALARLIPLLEMRARALGVRHPSVTAQPGGRILVEAPGDVDLARLQAVLTATLDVSLRLVDPGADPLDAGGPAPIVTGVMVASAHAGYDEKGAPDIDIRLDAVGAQRLAGATAANVGKELAVVVDGEVVAAPIVSAPITGGALELTGRFTRDDADRLALDLRSGGVPAGLRVITAETVPAP